MIKLCTLNGFSPKTDRDEIVFYMPGLEKYGDTKVLSDLSPSEQLRQWCTINARNLDWKDTFVRLYKEEFSYQPAKVVSLNFLRDLTVFDYNVVLLFPDAEDYRQPLAGVLREQLLECEVV